VQEVRIARADWDNDESVDLMPMHTILNLPNVCKISAFGVFTYRLPAGERWQLRKRSNMRELVLEKATVDVEGVSTLLSAYECLETLTIGYAGMQGDVADIDYAGIGKTLRQYGTNLVNLTILRNEDEDDLVDEDDLDDRSSLGSLAALTSLRKLTLDYEALYGRQAVPIERPTTWLQRILPVSLQYLDIVNVIPATPELFNEQVRVLMGDERFSGLESIRIRSEDDEHFGDEDMPEDWKVESLGGFLVFSKTAGTGAEEALEAEVLD